MPEIKSICVYCGSSKGKSEIYAEKAVELADALMKHEIGLIYGGGGLGLMGILARTMHDKGGNVTGIIPRALNRISTSDDTPPIGSSIIVDTMHERKAIMSQRADAFIALPGGFGTAEELIESVTWSQLRIHDKPVGLLNINGFYDSLIAWMDHAHSEGFIDAKSRAILVVSDDPKELVKKLMEYQDPVGNDMAYGLTKEMWLPLKPSDI